MLEQQPSTLGIMLDVLAGAADAHARRWLAAVTAFLARRLVPWLCWILACAAGSVGLMAVMYAALLRYALAASEQGTVELASRVLLGPTVAGAALGSVQWLAVRRAVPRPETWIVPTMLGWAAGAALAVALRLAALPLHVSLGWPGDRLAQGGSFGLVVGLTMGLGQQRATRSQAVRPGWWVLTSALGWGLGWTVGGLHSNEMLGGSDVGPAFHPAGVFAGVVAAPALAGALAGLVSGPALVTTLRLDESLPAVTGRPRAALPALAAALALLAVIAGPALVQRRQPAFRVQTITRWPTTQLFAVSTPRPATTPRPAGGSFGDGMFAATSVAAAQPRLPFGVIVPTFLPPGYELAKAQVPRALLRSPRLPPAMAWITLVYYDPARQQRGHDWRADPGALPDEALTVAESSAAGRPPVDLFAPPGAVHQFTLGGVPAVYLDATATQRPGSAAVVPNPAVNQLVLARAGTLITITGWRDGGVDRAVLEQIAASLR